MFEDRITKDMFKTEKTWEDVKSYFEALQHGEGDPVEGLDVESIRYDDFGVSFRCVDARSAVMLRDDLWYYLVAID